MCKLNQLSTSTSTELAPGSFWSKREQKEPVAVVTESSTKLEFLAVSSFFQHQKRCFISSFIQSVYHAHISRVLPAHQKTVGLNNLLDYIKRTFVLSMPRPFVEDFLDEEAALLRRDEHSDNVRT